MKLPIYQVDAFTSELFGGNPAAICPLDEWIDHDLMQSIALENNLSETAFFVRKGDRFDLKWFTPELEMDLCGHATLATAHIIFNRLHYEKEQVIFDSNSGELSVTKNNELLSMDFPTRTAVEQEDPVTGSAHSTLIPYWAEVLGKDKLNAIQVSKRKGELFCELHGDRVLISGKAVTYLTGQINV